MITVSGNDDILAACKGCAQAEVGLVVKNILPFFTWYELRNEYRGCKVPFGGVARDDVNEANSWGFDGTV